MKSASKDLSVLARADLQTESIVPRPPSRWKTGIGVPALLILAFAALLGYAARDQLWPAIDVQVLPVIVKASDRTGGGVAFQAPGWVEADPYMFAVSALTDGIVAEVRVLEGDRVKAGQVVARMVDDEAKLSLQRLEAELKERHAEVRASKAGLNAAQRNWDHPIERTRSVSIAENKLAEAKADLKKLEADIEVEASRANEVKEKLRREQSVGSDAIPEFQVVKTRLQLKTQIAISESVRAKRPILQARIKQLEADLKAARENLRLRIDEKKALEEAQAGLARAEAALVRTRAARAEAELRLKRMDVVATADGIVMQRLINPGDKLMLRIHSPHSAHAVHLYDPEKLQVRVDVPLADAARVSVGQKGEVVVEVLPDRVFKGEVTRVVHEADIQKNTLQVKVAIRDPVPELKPEMLARVKFLAPEKKVEGRSVERVYAREDLVATQQDGSATVWVVDQGRSVAVKRTVRPGHIRMKGWIEIIEGLQPGDRLIASDPTGLEEGKKVRVVGEAR